MASQRDAARRLTFMTIAQVVYPPRVSIGKCRFAPEPPPDSRTTCCTTTSPPPCRDRSASAVAPRVEGSVTGAVICLTWPQDRNALIPIVSLNS
jgi:hypothetical protein